VTLAYITHASCRLHEMGSYHPECPARLDAIHDRLISSGLDAHLQHYEAPEATDEQLARVHGQDYLEMIAESSPASGVHYLDPDTALNPYSESAARHAAGAVVLATDLVMRAECDTAFCAVRPPGHHAERNRAMGFCIYNSLAVGVAHALAEHDLERAAIVDFDVHHGNGTEDIFSDDPRVIMVGSFQHPLYPYSGFENVAENMHNVPLSAGTDGEVMRRAVTDVWLPALNAFRPQILFISAGFDAHREDPLANLKWSDADYTWVTQQLTAVAGEHCDGRIVSSLEGGYALSALGRSATLHVRALAGL